MALALQQSGRDGMSGLSVKVMAHQLWRRIRPPVLLPCPVSCHTRGVPPCGGGGVQPQAGSRSRSCAGMHAAVAGVGEAAWGVAGVERADEGGEAVGEAEDGGGQGGRWGEAG